MLLHEFNAENKASISLSSLEAEATRYKHNQLVKQTLVTIQKVFAQDADPKMLVEALCNQMKLLDEAGTTTYCKVMLAYFLCQLMFKLGDVEAASQISGMCLTMAKDYFGHQESQFVIEPLIIILNYKFDKATQAAPTSQERELAQLSVQAKNIE